MKKICFVTTVSITMKSFVVEIAKHLHNECGYDVTLICNTDDEFKASLPEYIRYIPVKMARGIDFSALGSIKEFVKIFKTEKFDLVQYSTPNASCYASIAAKIAKVPIRLYAQWGIRYVGLSGISRKIFKALEKLVCTLSTHVRAVSFKNMQFAVDEGLYPENKAKVIGNGGTIGVDMCDYDVAKKEEWKNKVFSEYNINADDFVFGFVGRVSADKGCTELLTAFKNIVAEKENAKLLMVGPLEDNCGISKELIDWARNSKQVVLTGMVQNKEMKRYYCAMDILVHPTYREGFGMVIQEAGALAVATITTKIPGASEVMADGESCVLVNPKNTEELENAMLDLITNLQKVKDLGNNAYTRTKTLYARPIMLNNILNDMNEIMNVK